MRSDFSLGNNLLIHTWSAGQEKNEKTNDMHTNPQRRKINQPTEFSEQIGKLNLIPTNDLFYTEQIGK